MNRSPLIFISAAEPSADLHGAALIRATLAVRPEARFVGVAGPKMVRAGCEPIFDMTPHSAMLLSVFGAAGHAIRMLNTADEHLRMRPFDAAVVMDSPTLHLPLAAKAHGRGIPVLYYIAPQLWAWGAYRIHRLRNCADRVAAILPFEESYFRDQGVNATFVGHPLAERFAEQAEHEHHAPVRPDGGQQLVALLPGSRGHVARELFRDQLATAERIASVLPTTKFAVSVANEAVAPVVREGLRNCSLIVEQCVGGIEHRKLLDAADVVLVASGTATLEVAFHRKPMIVMYKASRLFYHIIGRWMIQTPFLSLPNILANRQIVPEFMPYYTSTEPIAEAAIQLLQSRERRRDMVAELDAIVEPLRATRASQRTAEILLDLIPDSNH